MMTAPHSDSSAVRIHAEVSQPLLQRLQDEEDEEDEEKDEHHSGISLQTLRDEGVFNFHFEEEKSQRRPGFWTRLRMSMQRRQNRVKENELQKRQPRIEEKRLSKSQRRKRCCFAVPVVILSIFGLIHLLNVFLGYISLSWDDRAASLDWTRPNQASSDIASHLLDITHDVTPIPCHSHNDYWRKIPLYDALRSGCTGVEADVWLHDDDLFVGHSIGSLEKNKTFTSMYVDPLVKMLDYKNPINSSVKNGIFRIAPEQTLVLLVDFKTDGHALFPHVSQQLHALREKGYLSYFDGVSTVPGPITVVATGNAPFDLITANSTYRDMFFDAPLDRMYEAPDADATSPHAPSNIVTRDKGGQGTVGTSADSIFDSTNSYYASAKFSSAVGFTFFHLSSHQLDLIRGQVRGAHKRGLKARYWSAPKWPIGLRNKIWKILVEEGVDYLNGDDLYGMTRVDWGLRRHWSLIG